MISQSIINGFKRATYQMKGYLCPSICIEVLFFYAKKRETSYNFSKLNLLHFLK